MLLYKLTFFQNTNLDSSKYDNFEFDENNRKFYNWVENTVGEGEIAHYEQFLLFLLFLAHLSTKC